MLAPINTNVVPPGGWTVTIKGAGPTIQANNWSLFIKEVFKRLVANKMDRHGWKEETVDLMCRQRPDIPSKDVDVPTRDVTGDDVKRFLATIWEAWKAGAEPVSAEEQDRRAAICLQCPKKGYVSCMGGCGAMAQTLAEMTVGSKARLLPELHKASCLACGCELSTLTMYPLEVLKRVDKKINFQASEYWEKCWKVQSPNETLA